jgi:hypothetical protein
MRVESWCGMMHGAGMRSGAVVLVLTGSTGGVVAQQG